MEISIAVIIVLLGAVIALERMRRRLGRDNGSLREAEANLKERLQERDIEIARLEAGEKSDEERMRMEERNLERMKQQFENVCNRLFDEKRRRFSQEAKKDIDALINPFKDDIDSFRKKAEQMYETEGKERASLREQIRIMVDASGELQGEASRLSNALVGEAQVRGNWGEMALERILELSGLRKGVDYESQVTLSGEDGERLRPDVIVRLPGERDIVIDSKVALVHWMNAINAEDSKTRDRALTEHTAAIKRHVKELGGKEYQDAPGLRSLEMVFMFIPIEAAYLAALERERELIAEAVGRRVALVGPSTLMGVLSLVNHLWRMERHNANAEEVFRQAKGIQDKFENFEMNLSSIGAALIKARDSYDKAAGQFSSGKGNLKRRIRQLVELEDVSAENPPLNRIEDDRGGDEE